MTKSKAVTPLTTKATETAEQKAARLALEEMIAAQVTDRVFARKTIDELIPHLEKEVSFVTASNGFFKITKKPIGLFIEKLQDFSIDAPGVGALEAGVHLTVPKIPGKYLIQILSWYRDVNTRDRTEASNLFFWNHNNVEIPTTYPDNTPVQGMTIDGQLIIYTPKQENTGALSEFHMDPMVPWLRENTSLYLEIHSHNTMNAFFSGTDDANENMTQFYAVWGRVMDKEPAFTMRYVVGNTRVIVPMSAAFDIPQMEIMTQTVHQYQMRGDLDLLESPITSGRREEEPEMQYADFRGPWAKLEYPADWMTQHKKKAYVASSTGWDSTRKQKWDSVLKKYVDIDDGVSSAHTNYRPLKKPSETWDQYDARVAAWEAEEDRLGKLGNNLKKEGHGTAVTTRSDYQNALFAGFEGDDETQFIGTGEETYGDFHAPDPSNVQQAADYDQSEVELRFQDENERSHTAVECIEQVFEALTDSLYHWDLHRYVKSTENLM